MKILPAIRVAFVLCLGIQGAQAGGDDLYGDTEGHLPQFIGIARDIKSFKTIDSMRVVAIFKSQMLVTQTDAEGRFRIEGFIDGFDPEAVQIKCEKAGYTPVNVIRRKVSPEAPIEIECLSQPT